MGFKAVLSNRNCAQDKIRQSNRKVVYITTDAGAKNGAFPMVCARIRQRCTGKRTVRGGAALSQGTSRARLVAPYPTVPYSTVPYPTAQEEPGAQKDFTLSLSKKARGKESRCGKPAKMWKTLWKDCGKPGAAAASGAVRCGAAAGCAVALVRCRTSVQRRARWLAFLLREKMLDKLCKCILD